MGSVLSPKFRLQSYQGGQKEISNSPPSMLLPEVGKWSKKARFGTSLLLKNGHHAISVLGIWTLRIFCWDSSASKSWHPQHPNISQIHEEGILWDPRKFRAPIISSCWKRELFSNKKTSTKQKPTWPACCASQTNSPGFNPQTWQGKSWMVFLFDATLW